MEQTYPNIEIIICDDSTDDGVQEMVEHYLHSYSQIKYHKNEKNLFLKNWHKGYNLASGEYINYLMDDDMFHKDKISKMIRFFNEFENITLVTSYRQTINESGEFLSPIGATVRLYEEIRIMDGKVLENTVLTRCLNVIEEPTTVLLSFLSNIEVIYSFMYGNIGKMSTRKKIKHKIIKRVRRRLNYVTQCFS